MEERTCSVEDCGRGGKLTRGMCTKHYRFWLDHTPADQRPPAPRFDRQFEDFIDKSGECWIWTGPISDGYGFWSKRPERGLAHRISLARVSPPADPTLFACHRCDNPPCVNPEHLYWGTLQDNTRDYVTRQGVYNKGAYATVCGRGHEIAGENLRLLSTTGKRMCRTCDNDRKRESARRVRRTAA